MTGECNECNARLLIELIAILNFVSYPNSSFERIYSQNCTDFNGLST